MNEVVQLLPEIAAGYGLGQVAEQVALGHIKEHQRAYIRAHGGNVLPNVRQGVRRGLALTAIMGAISGGMIGETMVTHETKLHDTAKLTEAVDHTFGTGQYGDASDQRISHIATGVADEKGLEAQIMVAHNSTYELMTPKQTLTDRGYGAQTLPDAVRASIDNAANRSTGRNAGVLVINDGDQVGKPQTVIRYAKDHGNIPVFGVNVGPANTKGANDLRTIAKETHGKTWQLSKDVSSSTIAAAVRHDITPKAVAYKYNNDRLPWLAAALATGGASAELFRRRKRQAQPNYVSQ